jgi:hypothetical protein
VVSSPVVSARFSIRDTSRRVYTLTLALTIAVTLLGIGCRAPAPSAQDRVAGVSVAIDAQMAKGPASAAVTIVEFSDYQ